MSNRRQFLASAAALAVGRCLGHQPARATVDGRVTTIPDLGSAQGISLHDGFIYMYGDLIDAKPRVGVVREYDGQFRPTGRAIRLTTDGRPLILHPTGLTWHERFGCFLGDTVEKRSMIYQLDWAKALTTGCLDGAIKTTIIDDAAINGGRPEFVRVGNEWHLASADYGDVRPELRLYDVEPMLAKKRTSAPGVAIHRVLVSPFNQNLHWDDRTGEITLAQNTTPGLGWRLDVLNLVRAIADGRGDGPGVRVSKTEFAYPDELEGYRPLPDGRHLFLTSSRRDNLRVGKIVR